MACAGRILRKTLVGEGFGSRRTLQQHRQQQRLRLIASWTKIELEIPYTANTTPTTTKKKLQLQIQEQLTSPPPSTSSSSSFSSSSPRSTNTSFDRTGRRIWPCAIPLLKTILKEVSYEDASATTTITNTQMYKHNDNNDKAFKRSPRTVLELGAGCGVVGMGLAASGFFQHVCMTDVDIDWLQQNIRQNYKFQSSNTNNHKTSSTQQQQQQQQQQHSIENNSSIISEGVHVESQRLPWGQPFHPLQSSLASHLQHGQLSKRNKAYHWDYIVGSDLLYDVNAHNDLLWTLDHYAMTSLAKSRNRYRNAPSSSRSCNEKDRSRLQEEMSRTSNGNENDDITGTKILLAYPRRADDTEQLFLSQVRSMGIFHVDVHDLSLLQDDDNEDNDPKDQNVKTPSPLGLMRLVKKDSF